MGRPNAEAAAALAAGYQHVADKISEAMAFAPTALFLELADVRRGCLRLRDAALGAERIQ